MLSAALRAKYFGIGKPFGRSEFDQLLGHCEAVTAGPINCFGPGLIEAYPEAKVVLCEREYESWFRSFEAMIDSVYSPIGTVLKYTDPMCTGKMRSVAEAWLPGQFRARTKEECKKNARWVYEEHYREIREATPEGRLLEYRLGDGWGPLCKFLGKEVPDVPFPKLNEAAEFKLQLRIGGIRGIKRSLRNLGVVVGLLTAFGGALYWFVST